MTTVDGQLVVAGTAVGVGAAAQALTGFGFSLVSAPFLIAAASAPRGVQWNLVLSAGLNLVLLAGSYRQVRWREVGRLLIPAVIATVGAGLLARHADHRVLTVAAGAICLVATVFVAIGWRPQRPPGPVGAVTAGGMSGAMNVVAGIGGPPVVLYGLTAGWSTEAARATLQAFFLGINLVAIPSLGTTSVPPALPIALVVGLAAGIIVSRRVPQALVRALVLILAAGGSALAVLRGAGVL